MVVVPQPEAQPYKGAGCGGCATTRNTTPTSPSKNVPGITCYLRNRFLNSKSSMSSILWQLLIVFSRQVQPYFE